MSPAPDFETSPGKRSGDEDDAKPLGRGQRGETGETPAMARGSRSPSHQPLRFIVILDLLVLAMILATTIALVGMFGVTPAGLGAAGAFVVAILGAWSHLRRR
ncbi:hypothetical protein IU483_24780 [Streptomyces gardneri]|nr:hypothetical protein [Streptomyces gardneri]